MAHADRLTPMDTFVLSSEVVRSPSSIDDLSFIDMIERFAHTGVNDASSSALSLSGEEKCPLCPRYMRLDQFASHVYVCMRESEDAELAQRLAAESGASQSIDEYKPVEVCPAGSSCSRTDANHFIMLQHPPASCPCCGEEWPVETPILCLMSPMLVWLRVD
jgi:hypothetical protein